MSDDSRDELTGWRLYYLHRGRLCAPYVGDLSPIAHDEHAACLDALTGAPHRRHTPPATGCYCGWRIADNLEALRPAVQSMCTPGSKIPVQQRVWAEHPPGVDNPPWGLSEDVLARWDWPAPALVRVRGTGGVRRADDVAEREAELVAHFEGTGMEVVREGYGMWRAARLQIVGPIITGQSPEPIQFWPVAGDAADYYGVPVFVSELTFPAIFEQVAAGWLPPQPNRAQRRAMQRGRSRARPSHDDRRRAPVMAVSDSPY